MGAKRVIVVGAGAGGMMAAGRAAEMGAEVFLMEKMERPGRKLLISGKTRCNLSNSRGIEAFIPMYGPNGRFLYSAFHRYFRDDLLSFLKRYGIEVITERGGRIFPASGDSRDVVWALCRYLNDFGVKMRTGFAVNGIEVESGHVTGVRTDSGFFPATEVVLATGGASFPGTGSTGDGYRMASAIGHTIVALRPGLVPLVVHESERVRKMQGVSLRNVRLTAYRCRVEEIDQFPLPVCDYGRGTGHERSPWPIIESRMGEMMMTHFGIGGPITLQMSLAVVDALREGPVSVSIDLKPALSESQLNARLQRDMDRHGKRSYRRILAGLLPRKMIEPFIEMTGVPPEKPAHQIDAVERKRLTGQLKSLRFSIKNSLPLTAAMVTVGGVSLTEIDPRTMASRLVDGLFFCGEVMDLDADTGGYNLQAAFSTGYVAGEHAATHNM